MRTAEEYAREANRFLTIASEDPKQSHEMLLHAQVNATMCQAAATRELVGVLGPIVAREKAK